MTALDDLRIRLWTTKQQLSLVEGAIADAEKAAVDTRRLQSEPVSLTAMAIFCTICSASRDFVSDLERSLWSQQDPRAASRSSCGQAAGGSQCRFFLRQGAIFRGIRRQFMEDKREGVRGPLTAPDWPVRLSKNVVRYRL